ncbi:MAG: Uma2 family endonuclease [Cyanobacteria bacterium]|nr:Uma2 family endonuclease [Cyanobacteriota bacterium]
MTAYSPDLKPLLNLTEEQFYTLCQANPDIKFERNRRGNLILMAPTGGGTGYRNSELNADFVIWNRQTQLGKVFDSSTCFHLLGGSDRSPDIAWVRQECWEALTPEQQEKFPPLAPDFVLELMSPSDALAEAQAKMEEYRDSGVRLGWLLHRKLRRVWIYRPEQTTQLLENPERLSGEEILPGFSLNTRNIW